MRSVLCPLLIGRDDLLELADRRLDDVAAGRGQFLLLAGEAGIGKTRLVGAIERKAQARGFATVEGCLAPQDHDVPVASILDMARSMTRLEPFADLGRALLVRCETTTAIEHVQRRRLVMDLVDLIVAALPFPTMLSFWDLQWADDLSLEVIAELARRTRDRSLLLTGDYRVEDVPPGTSFRDWRARLITQRIAEEVRLAPLSEAETALATTLLLDTGLPAPRDVAAAVFERTDGIPLHIEELLGALSPEARSSGFAIREATVPATIEDAVVARLALLSPEAQATARAGAVIGRCFVPEVLAGIMDLPRDSIEAPLQELIDHAVLEPPGLRGLYDFRHQLLRDALYRTIPASQRRRFHARAGEFGATLEGASEIHASLHYERAGLHREAFEAAFAGGRDATRLSAHREAFELYQRAVENMPKDLADVEQGAILEAFATEALAIEEIEIAAGAARDAEAAYRKAGRPALAIGAVAVNANVERRQGLLVAERLATLHGLMAELDQLPDSDDVPSVRANLAAYLGLTLIDARSLPEARSWLAIAAENGDRVGDPEWRKVADWKSAYADTVAGDVVDGIAGVGRVALSAERDGLEDTGVSAFRDAATLAANALDYRTAARWIDEGLRYADTIEQSYCAHVMSATSAVVAWANGDWVEASFRSRQAVADKGCRRAVAMSRWGMGYVELGRGHLDAATAELEDALRLGETSQEVELILPPSWALAEVALQRGDPAAAMALCRDALERAQATGEMTLLTPFVVTGVRAAQQAGRPDEAEAWLDACAAHLAPIPSVARAALEHGRGLVALASGATGIARVSLEAAVAGWDERPRVWEATWARLDLASCLTRSNRFAEAVALTNEARALATSLDSRPLADRAETLQRMARGHAPVDEPWRPLTAREFAVARLITEGLTNAEIASALSITPTTARSHVEHILAKLGASRRAEIAAWAVAVERAPAVH